ncbi:Uncharacterised protein [Starkeya nomas]|uniref:Uncharacterized protein n=1 Tax=Starkeya nomas TaxID=2666134 RepID=A0A5S9R5I8_9HYPH|nr:hypothetical protein [Starkeya nomas]CAA0129016.1 Uncharacterised protein [Starkeya nomas]
MTRRRSRNAASVDIGAVLAADPDLAAADAAWLARGYVRTSCRLWLCRDGRYTARLVWRNRAHVCSTISHVVQGLIIA